jgi:hypothetical protein
VGLLDRVAAAAARVAAAVAAVPGAAGRAARAAVGELAAAVRAARSEPAAARPEPAPERPAARPEPAPERPAARPEPAPERPAARPEPAPERPAARPERPDRFAGRPDLAAQEERRRAASAAAAAKRRAAGEAKRAAAAADARTPAQKRADTIARQKAARAAAAAEAERRKVARAARREAAAEQRKRDAAGPGPVDRASRITTPGEGERPAGDGTVAGAAGKIADLAAAKPGIDWSASIVIDRGELPEGAILPRGTGQAVELAIPPDLAREGAPAIVAWIARVLGLPSEAVADLPADMAVPFGYYGDQPPEEPEDFDADRFIEDALLELEA